MVLFQFNSVHPHQFHGEYKPLSEAFPKPDSLTAIPPPSPIFQHPHVWLCWNPEKQEWYYREVYIPLLGSNDLDDILDYKALRKLEYPPQSEYLDAVSKMDDAQLQAYYRDCKAVKHRFPKGMQQVSRRSYLVTKIGLVTERDTTKLEPPAPDESMAPNETISTLRTDIDTLKVARTLQKTETTRLKNLVAQTNSRIEELPAFQAFEETRLLREELKVANEKIAVLTNSLDLVVTALRKKYII
jgi:hypothetical protein